MCTKNSYNALNYLLNIKSINVNQTNADGNTPLHLAIIHRQKRNCDQLLAHRAINKQIANRQGITAEQLIKDERKSIYTKELSQALKNKNSAGIRQLIIDGADVNYSDQQGRTPLKEAIKNKDTELLNFLLSRPDINTEDAFVYAAECNNIQAARLLKKRKGNVNKKDAHGFTALHRAVINNNSQMLEILLQSPDLDINITNDAGETPLYYAAKFGKSSIVFRLLVTPGIDINRKANNNQTPLDIARKQKNTECVKHLLRFGAQSSNASNR